MVLPGVLRGLLAPRLATTVTKSTTSKPCRPRVGTPLESSAGPRGPSAADYAARCLGRRHRRRRRRGAAPASSWPAARSSSRRAARWSSRPAARVTVGSAGPVSVSAGVVVGRRVGRVALRRVASRRRRASSGDRRPSADLPATNSGTVMITAATRKPSRPVTTATFHARPREDARAARGSRRAARRAVVRVEGSNGLRIGPDGLVGGRRAAHDAAHRHGPRDDVGGLGERLLEERDDHRRDRRRGKRSRRPDLGGHVGRAGGGDGGDDEGLEVDPAACWMCSKRSRPWAAAHWRARLSVNRTDA